jgi:hypothetical protein
MADLINNDKKLLIEQWVNAYSNVPHTSVEKIKKEVNMSYTATTISEHIWNEGKMEGVIEGQIKILESLYLSAVLSKEQFENMVDPLRKQLEKILCAV